MAHPFDTQTVTMTTLNAEHFETALMTMRPRLLSFARLQLRSAAAAEDVVQDAILAALEGINRFTGAASLQTWVFSILKNKIIDVLRQYPRTSEETDAEEALDHLVSSLFDERGHWIEMPPAWGNPHASLEQKRFWDVMDACLTGLPAAQARAFTMREFLELDAEEICQALSISTSNYWMLMHRARLGLRECLGIRWFGGSHA